MSTAPAHSSDVAFTPAVKAIQTRKGSRESYAHVEARGGWRTETHKNPAGFLAENDSIDFSTATADGHPYYSGNRQYITQGNLSENPKAHIFVMDYAHRRRVKIWGEARVVDDDPALTQSLMPKGYKARAEQVILFTVAAWDANCPQHIPQRFEAADVAAALADRDQRIEMLEREIERLRGSKAVTS